MSTNLDFGALRGSKRRLAYVLSKIYYRRFYSFAVDAYGGTDLRPTERIEISPEAVQRLTGRIGSDKVKDVREDIGTVMDGTWDRESGTNIAPHLPRPLTEALFATRFDETILYSSFESRYGNGTPWSQTEYYRRVMRCVERGVKWHGCTSEADVPSRFEAIDRIYHSIRTDGYRTQDELHTYANYLDELCNEVVVDIDRNGDPLFVCGRHRLAIAKVLELETIPAVVAVCHHEYANPG